MVDQGVGEELSREVSPLITSHNLEHCEERGEKVAEEVLALMVVARPYLAGLG